MTHDLEGNLWELFDDDRIDEWTAETLSLRHKSGFHLTHWDERGCFRNKWKCGVTVIDDKATVKVTSYRLYSAYKVVTEYCIKKQESAKNKLADELTLRVAKAVGDK